MNLNTIKKRFFRFFINIGMSGKYTGEKAFSMSDYLIRYALLNFIIIFGVGILVLFAILNFKSGLYSTVLVCIIMILIGITSFVLARTRVKQIIPSVLLMIFYGTLCLMVTWLGDAKGANFLFIYMYPLTTIMLLGMRNGIILSSILIILISFEMFVPGISRYEYGFDFSIRMLVNYILVFTVMIVIETTRKTKDRFIETQTRHLNELKEEAVAANRTKSNFLATMSHEIRTPLNAIIGIAQIEMQDENLPEKHATAFEKIYGSGSSLLGIINDILDMSKIETGKLELNPVEYDMPSLINDAVQLNIVRIGSKRIEFCLVVDENLPSRLLCDELRIKQILNNLLSNAIKYTEKGEVTLSVNCQAAGEEAMLSFSIKDTGQGMKEEDRKKLFSEYTRFNESANRAVEGTGLGLNITKRLVEMMDGTITVESEYGSGSTFMVTIRQKAVECEPVGAELAKRLSNFTFTSKSQNKQLITREPMPYGSVLVVDDVDTNLYVARGLLSPYKLEIETACSGFAAIEKTESGRKYDVIFMDHMMPQMDGIETTRRLREGGYDGVIVALTANALIGNDEMFAKKGFDGFIPKPIDIRQLNAALNKFVRDRHPEEAEKYRPETVAEEDAKDCATALDPKVKQIFREDAKKAIVALSEAAAADDMKLFTITAHAMKSALANVGEPEASRSAYALESAGQQGDRGFIGANTGSFIKTLEGLIEKFSPEMETGDGDVTEDTAYLIEQLRLVKAACDDFDDDGAYAALDRLKEKAWGRETSGRLERIRDMLFVYSDFDGAAKEAETFIRDASSD